MKETTGVEIELVYDCPSCGYRHRITIAEQVSPQDDPGDHVVSMSTGYYDRECPETGERTRVKTGRFDIDS